MPGSGLPEVVGPDEDLARFLMSRSHWNRDGTKPSAFLPWPVDRGTSVSRHGRTPPDRLWSLGSQAAGERTVHGAAFIKASDVTDAGLSVSADEPPDLHALVRGWPWHDSDPVLQKAQQLEKAQALARAAGPPLLK